MTGCEMTSHCWVRQTPHCINFLFYSESHSFLSASAPPHRRLRQRCLVSHSHLTSWGTTLHVWRMRRLHTIQRADYERSRDLKTSQTRMGPAGWHKSAFLLSTCFSPPLLSPNIKPGVIVSETVRKYMNILPLSTVVIKCQFNYE